MRVELEILDGNNKGKRISLRNGLFIGRIVDQLAFDDTEMAEFHAKILLDSNKSWKIECLNNNTLRLGFDEIKQARLIYGLVFSLGQTSFKVVQREGREVRSWQVEIKNWLENNPGPNLNPEIFFFTKPVRVSFIQGPQYEEVYTLSYGPRELGHNNLDLNIKDPSAPPLVARFFLVSGRVYIENLCGDKATLNDHAFDQHPVSNGDKLKVGSNVIELSLLT